MKTVFSSPDKRVREGRSRKGEKNRETGKKREATKERHPKRKGGTKAKKQREKEGGGSNGGVCKNGKYRTQAKEYTSVYYSLSYIFVNFSK